MGFRIDDRITPALRRLDSFGAENVVARGAMELAKIAKRNTPRDTGALHDSIRTDVGGSTATVGYASKYAPHVEYGHRQNVGQYVKKLGKRLKAPYVHGQHFLRRSVAQFKPTLKRFIKDELRRKA